MRNRELVLAAAERVFASNGIDAPLEEVARQAGVGTATLYRHFPTRLALIQELYQRAVDAFEELLDRSLADPDPWQGLVTFVEGCIEYSIPIPSTLAIARRLAAEGGDLSASDRLSRPIGRLTQRAVASGVVRPDLDTVDVVLIPFILADLGPDWRRACTYLMRGLRAPGLPDLPMEAPPLSVEGYARLIHGSR